MNIGNAIKSLRKEMGLNQIEFASASGLSQSYLSLIEKGKKEPTLSTLKAISNVLSIPTPILIFLSLEKNDVDEDKQNAYELIEPTLKSLLLRVFYPNSKSMDN